MARSYQRALMSKRSGCRLPAGEAETYSGMGPATHRQIEFIQALLAKSGQPAMTELEVKRLRIGAASDMIRRLVSGA